MSASDPVVVELRARKQHYRALLEALPDLMFRVDRIGTYLEVWPADWPDLVGRNLRDVLPPDLAERAMGLVAEVCDGQPIGIVEYDLDIGGELQTFEARGVPCGVDEVWPSSATSPIASGPRRRCASCKRRSSGGS